MDETSKERGADLHKPVWTRYSGWNERSRSCLRRRPAVTQRRLSFQSVPDTKQNRGAFLTALVLPKNPFRTRTLQRENSTGRIRSLRRTWRSRFFLYSLNWRPSGPRSLPQTQDPQNLTQVQTINPLRSSNFSPEPRGPDGLKQRSCSWTLPAYTLFFTQLILDSSSSSLL